MFGEKTSEWVKVEGVGKDLPVYQSPKYVSAKKKAIEIIESGKYDLAESDFWILMNLTGKRDKMAYTALIISHNGCLKINDRLDGRFDSACVSLDKEGWGGSLVYTYNNPAQGIYENGEVSKGNCKNEYPYAMAFKRCFDRVVLKLSKLAYDGIMSDSESDDFKENIDAPAKQDKLQDKPRMNADEMAASLAQTYGTSPEEEAKRNVLIEHIDLAAKKRFTPAQIDAACVKKFKKPLLRLNLEELKAALELISGA